MNAASDFAEQWEGIRRGYESDRLAHAYVIVGSPRGNAGAFAEAMLHLILAGGDHASPTGRRIAHRSHTDVVWIEPQSKSRLIRVDEMRVLNQRIQQTALEGDWKAGVILYADRMNEQAANAFLKTLEEPAGRALLLLLTDTPHALLPTIRSRCQQVVLSSGAEPLAPEKAEALLAILRQHGGADPMEVFVASESLRALLDTIKQGIEDEIEQREGEDPAVYDARVQSRLLEVRSQLMTALMHWQRDLLFCVLGAGEERTLYYPAEQAVLQEQAEGLTLQAALRRLAAVEDMARRLERNVPPTLVFDAGFAMNLYRRQA